MIGQTKNKELILNWRLNKSIPRFIIIEGDIGSGRLTLAKLIMSSINGIGIISENSISAIREIIENAYTVNSTTFYIFRDCDDMSVAAKNSLLKVVEEPPNNAYFIMTVQSLNNMLSTIRSRATCIKMEPYTTEHLKSLDTQDLLIKYINTPGQIKNTDIDTVKQVEKAVKDILLCLDNCSGLGILKVTSNLKNKETDTDKIDCVLFLQVFEKNIDVSLMKYNALSYIEQCKQEFKKSSINKKASIECMLIKLLEEMKRAKIS